MSINKELETAWQRLLYKLKPQFRRKPTLQTMLFLIGVQELGQLHREFEKEEKQDLMHIAVCKLMAQQGYYELVGRDNEGWPHYRPTGKSIPKGLEDQEHFLKSQILHYFEEN